MNVVEWWRSIKEEWNKPYPIDPIQEGKKVMYLGKEWTVTQRRYLDSMNKWFRIERINELGQHESVSPPYNSDLVRLTE